MPAQGSYFITADVTGLGYDGDDTAFARAITAEAGVAAIPVSAFYAEAGPRSYVRFAFCKQPGVLEEALRRLGVWLSR